MTSGQWFVAREETPAQAVRDLPATGRQPRAAGGLSRRGVTILELLVVMLILLMVTAAAIPIVAPAMQNRQMREAARLASSYFSVARSRAIETGRPVGVVIERFNGQPFGQVLSQVEVPAPYAGDVLDDLATVAVANPMNDPTVAGEQPADATSKAYFDNLYNVGGTTLAAVWFTARVNTGTFNLRLVRLGDQIQFAGQGPRFKIYGPDTNGDGVIDDPGGGANVDLDIAYTYPATDLDGDGFNDPYTRNPIPPDPLIDSKRFPWENGVVNNGPIPQQPTYQVFRQPTRSTTAPLQLPEGIVVDLVSSGMGTMGTFNSAAYTGNTENTPHPAPRVPFDPVIMFSPSGRLESVSQSATGKLAPPTDAVYVLLGRRELMHDVLRDDTSKDIVDRNLSPVPDPPDVQPAPPPHFWVSIGYQTGLVTVTEVAPNFQETRPGNLVTTVMGTALQDARQFARQSQSVGGR